MNLFYCFVVSYFNTPSLAVYISCIFQLANQKYNDDSNNGDIFIDKDDNII